MNLTEHARKRMNQRAISSDLLEIAFFLGAFEKGSNGADKIVFGKKQCQQAISGLKQLIQKMERAKNISIVMYNGQILTTYKSR